MILLGEEKRGKEGRGEDIPRFFDAAVLQGEEGVFDGEDLVVRAL